MLFKYNVEKKIVTQNPNSAGNNFVIFQSLGNLNANCILQQTMFSNVFKLAHSEDNNIRVNLFSVFCS